MQEYSPKRRSLVVITETGDEWIASHMHSREQVDALFEHKVSFMARKLEPEKLLGTALSVLYRPTLASSQGQQRAFHGICADIHQSGALQDRGYEQFTATLVPWLWLLQHRSHCRVFQEQKTSDIIKTLVDEHGFSSQLDLVASGDQPREYCVQYNETDLAFIERLLAEEGWHYHFQQDKDTHTLVIGSDNNCFPVLAEASAEYFVGSSKLEWAITRWQHHYSIAPDSVQTSDYNYELAEAIPGNKMNSVDNRKACKNLQHYFYPGRYQDKTAGTGVAQRAIEAYDCRSSLIKGVSSLSSFTAGGQFNLDYHPDPGEKGQYLLLEVTHELTAEESGQSFAYINQFQCIPSERIYRPKALFKKPRITGLQSAVVTGQGSEELHADEWARVKVQFHWDTQGQGDDSSSCWVRVAQPLAGNQFGCQVLPRVGDEVLVSFLDDDPDRPIVTASVYNHSHKPPFDSPSQYGFKFQSTPDGGAETYSELRFDCQKDQEQVFLQAEKDMVISIKNDRNETIVGNLQEEIQSEVTRLVKKDDKLTVEGEQTIKVSKNINTTTETNYQLSASGHLIQKAGSDWSATVKGQTSMDSTGDISLSSKGNIESQATSTLSLDGTSIKLSGKQAIDCKVGACKLSMSASALELSCGPGKIKISPSGVEISGINVKAEGKVQAELKGGVGATVEGSVKTDIKGTMVTIQGNAMTQVKAGAMVELQGGIAKIN